ncbi:MAG TPA: FtsW/RodA/SpoVE family cell cycle protein [Candidatus Acidoferrum sp.]|jgi:rod shape determining protein RodA|nr:FtsW/RodA/SpoVE family cell cycle protein [Candidatus Acidoferrum sp.]
MVDPSINEHGQSFDRLQLFALAGLMVVGALFICSATHANPAFASLPWYDQMWVRQLIWYTVGMGMGAVMCFVEYHVIARWAVVLYWAMIICLVAVLIHGIGSTHGWGARRWIDLPGFQFQPSEFAKLAFILAMANFLSRPIEELRRPAIFWKAIGLIMLPFALILKEPDLGSAMVLVPTGLAMMYVGGVPKRYLALLIGTVGLLGVLFIADILFAPRALQFPMKPYQRERLLVYFGRDYTHFASSEATPAELQNIHQQQLGDEYNVRQALISVGSGGLTGKGWRHGTQNALGYLPRAVAHNDFIFSVIAEEEGFVGSVIVLTLYAVVLFAGLRIAGQARDRLGKLVAVGVVTLIFSHVFINIGMNIRIMPVTGVPLPLVSYGGSSVLGSLIAAGLMQNVYIHRKGY